MRRRDWSTCVCSACGDAVHMTVSHSQGTLPIPSGLGGLIWHTLGLEAVSNVAERAGYEICRAAAVGCF